MVKRTMLLPVAAMVVLGWLLLPANEALAQCEGCEGEEIASCTDPGKHKLSAGSGRIGLPHSDCQSCMSGPASQCHPKCRCDGSPVAHTPAYEQLMQAAQQGDLLGVLMAGQTVADAVSFEESRFAIQVRSCSGMLVANLPVPRDVAELVALVRTSSGEHEDSQ